MMQAVLVTVVLGLLSVGASQAAPLTCEDLLKPMELSSFNQILGKWSSIALSSDGAGWKHLEINSAWIDVSEATPNKTMYVAQFFNITQKRLGTKCIKISYNFTLHDNETWSSEFRIPTSTVLLTTCPDCLLSLERWSKDGKPYKSLKLLSRRRELTAAELDFYNQQVDCLNLPKPVFMDPQNDLCPHISLSVEDFVENLPNLLKIISNIFLQW